MSRKKIEQIRNTPMFRKADWIILVAIVVVAIALLIAAFALQKEGTLRAVEIRLDQKCIATYDFDDAQWEYDPAYQEYILDEGDGRYRIYSDADKDHYNLIRIDPNARKVEMLEANCSSRADCVYMQAITAPAQVIVCVPHGLVIEGIGDSVAPPVLG